MVVSGETCDRSRFANYIQRNLAWHKYKNGYELDLESTAEFTRSELATAIRKGPYQVNLLIGGYDAKEERARLFWFDYLGTMQEVKKGAHGYAGYFVSSVLDDHFKKGMTLDEGIECAKQCINELKARFLISQPKFDIKIITKKGIEEQEFE